MIGEDHSCYAHTVGNRNFKRIPLRLIGDRTYQRQARLGVISERADNKRRPSAGLLPSRLWVEGESNQMTRVRDEAGNHQISLPSGLPQSVSLWQFSAVIRPTRSANSNFRCRGRNTMEPSGWTVSAKRSPSEIFPSVTIPRGIFTPRPYPHFDTIISLLI